MISFKLNMSVNLTNQNASVLTMLNTNQFLLTLQKQCII